MLLAELTCVAVEIPALAFTLGDTSLTFVTVLPGTSLTFVTTVLVALVVTCVVFVVVKKERFGCEKSENSLFIYPFR